MKRFPSASAKFSHDETEDGAKVDEEWFTQNTSLMAFAVGANCESGVSLLSRDLSGRLIDRQRAITDSSARNVVVSAET